MRLLQSIKIDGNPILVPDQDVKMERSDLDSAESGRDESGVMHRIVVRFRVSSWTLTYSRLTPEEYRYLKSLISGKPWFVFSCPDEFGINQDYRAYCSEDSVSCFNLLSGDYRNLTLKIIEC